MDGNEMDKALREVKENSKYIIETMFTFSKINRTYYEALLAQGFSKDQALELVKAQVSTMMQGGRNE